MADRAHYDEETMSLNSLSRTVLKAICCVALLLLIGLSSGCGSKSRPKVLDFSSSNSVSIELGESQTEYGTGLDHIYFENDGLTAPVTLEGVPCRHLKLASGEFGYFYFAINRTFKKRDARNVRIDVDYFDLKPGTLTLHYDATESKNVPNPAYAEAPQRVLLHGSKLWQTATFHIEGASFKNGENSQSDFRICITPPELYVRRVTITREGN
jgi:hypothetical protein